ncbi:hypothetical protein HZS_413 [Henneguya salminicola]|uniref:Ribonuclease P protein subunit p20 (Trinotate prediction) n=1 Tax=Henneguya salminicola TaxID=69463 RepID=A0A6G3MK57_HENSL|nr:hypothetical protein HZS_413 [Henneguya salminicola]
MSIPEKIIEVSKMFKRPSYNSCAIKPLIPSRNEVFVHLKTPLLSQLCRCRKVMEKYGRVTLHALGGSIPLSVGIALQLCQKSAFISSEVETGTTEIPYEKEGGKKYRKCSIIKITLIKCIPSEEDAEQILLKFNRK